MVDPAHALFANEAFYLAFESADLEAMEALWAARHEVVCLHPGWPPLFGRDAVLASWRGILTNARQPAVTMFGARAVTVGDAVDVVCFERIGDQTLVATNLFVLEDDVWRIVHHQAGPCAEPPEMEQGTLQ